MLRASAFAFAGHIEDALELAGEQYARAVAEGSKEGQGWFALVRAVALLDAGGLRLSARYSSEAAAVFREIGWPWWTRWALSALAHALALQGLGRAAASVDEEIGELAVDPRVHLGAEIVRARGWTAVATGDVSAARALFLQAAELARWSGACIIEARALHDLVRIGDGSVAPRLEALSAVAEGPGVPARAVHARALSARRPALFEEASASFEASGAILLAAEAAADAAVAWRTQGDPRRAAAAQRRARSLAERCEGAATPALSTPGEVRAVLTRRELDIARLAAEGLSNKEIAARLFLSYRTVENKLHAAYAKLGVAGRHELASALEGL
jgi:DNA-binding CsgD family transcriptional regulator